MNQSLIVRGAPQEYECKVGAWEQLEEHLHRRNLKKLLLLRGEKSWEVAKKYFPDLSAFTISEFFYGNECTDKRVAEVATLVEKNEIEGIISVGGGKISDLGKAAAYKCGIPIIILPTLASTCAAYTPLSVMYNQDGSMARYDIFPVSNALVLIEPRILLESPLQLMIAGIGDTIAKWYEADAMMSQLPQLSIELQVAKYAAKQCRDVLLKSSSEALSAMQEKKINQAFLDVIETNILLGGMVGGYGDDYGRTSGAHSIHDALTILEESHSQLHGNKVAYGILVQLVIEDKWDEIDRLVPFYHELGLPTSLVEMNIHNLTEEQYQNIGYRATEPHETIHFMKETITSQVVIEAMQKLEIEMNKLS